MIRVDAHHHVWTIARGDYGWMSPDLSIARDYGLDDLRPLLGGITATVLVQAAATEAETAFMLDVARASAGLVRGVVGWTDLAAPGAPARIAELARIPLLKGLRPMLQDIEDTGWILRPAVQPALAAMARHGLRFDALLKPRHLAVIGELAQRHPDLPVVIDHAAKPDIANGSFQPWARHMGRPRPRDALVLQGLRPRHRGAGGLAGRRSAPLCRPSAGNVRAGPADVGQRLAGRHPGEQLQALARCCGDAAAGGHACRDIRRHGHGIL
jgi:predicted TIM-barrel fold metal-dependent hydrolase